MTEHSNESQNQLREETLQKVFSAGDEIVEAYLGACSRYGMNPGITRLFAVGSIIKNNGNEFGPDSDVDLIFSVEYPDESLASAPSDVSSRSESEDERERRHAEMLNEFQVIWEKYSITAPLNIPYGESMPEVWGLPLYTIDDFPADRPGLLIASLEP